jgi:hypothetical protein
MKQWSSWNVPEALVCNAINYTGFFNFKEFRTIIVAVNRNKVFLFSHSTHSLHVSARANHLQVNIIVSCEVNEKIKDFVAIDGHFNKVLVKNATGCNPQK